jgi:hypothetical protein
LPRGTGSLWTSSMARGRELKRRRTCKGLGMAPDRHLAG